MYDLPKYLQKHDVVQKEELSSIDDLSNIGAKIENLTALLECPAAKIDANRGACAELLELLRKYYPDCLLLTCGSLSNGFGMKHSDLDLLFLPFPEYFNLDWDKINTPAPEPSSILTGEISREYLLKLNEFSHIQFIRTALRSEKEVVSKTYPFTYTGLNIQFANEIACNLHIKNRLLVFRSELLDCFRKLDVRVKPLVLILRHWGHMTGFIKKNNFNSYAFTILVIFFLQNTSPPVLPSVQHLIEISGFSRITADWQTAFATDINLISKSENTETTAELLMHFFQFYWNFDFLHYIASPYKGTSLSIKDIKSSEDKNIAEFFMNTVNIQDVFDLSHNVCKKEIPCNAFKVSLFIAYQMLLNKNEKFKFSTLFNPWEYDKVCNLQYGRYLLGKKKISFINLNYECHASVCKDASNLQTWYDKACQALFDVLQYGLLMECEIIYKICWECEVSSVCEDNDIESKNGMPAIDLMESLNVKNTPFDLELLLSLQCAVYYRVWHARQLYTQLSETRNELEQFSNPILNAEYDISKAMVEKNPSADTSEPLLHFKCECYKHCSPQVPGIIIILSPVICSKAFSTVSEFINTFVSTTVRKVLCSDK